jgi:hypothetical protein
MSAHCGGEGFPVFFLHNMVAVICFKFGVLKRVLIIMSAVPTGTIGASFLLAAVSITAVATTLSHLQANT